MSTSTHRPHYNVTFALLCSAAVAYALLQSLVAPALLEIQRDLGTTTAGVAWVLTAYLLSASVVTPIAGRLGDMFGKKRVLVFVLFALAAGTAVAAIATTLPVMILGRVIQGAGGAIFPLAFSIIRDEFPRERVPPRHRAHLRDHGHRRRRTVGGAIGRQVAAGVVMATATATGAVTERGFTLAFASALAVGALVAFMVPRRRAVRLEPVPDLA